MKKLIFLIIILVSFFPTLMQSQCAPFHPGYINIGQLYGHNYYLSIDDARPTDAQAAAEALGGYLVVIDSEIEDDFIGRYIDELTYIGLNDATTEGTLEWFSGDPVGYTNIDPCGFCTPNSDDQDYVVKEPWGAGGWSFSNFWNARKYIVEIPCGTSNTECAFYNELEVTTGFITGVADQVQETADGYEFRYERFGVGTRTLIKWNMDKSGQTISDELLEMPYPTGMDFGRFSNLGDYFFMHEVDGLNPQLVKVDFSGNIVWTRTYTVNNTISNITYTASRDGWEDTDGILITGHSGSGSSGLRQPYLIKTDLDGNELWQQFLPNENTFVSLNVFSRSSDGGYFLRLKAGISDKIIKIDADGNEVWTYTVPFLEERTFIGESSDGSAFYYTEGAGGFFTDELLLIKINANDGSFIWENNLGDYFSLTNTSPFGFRIKGAVPANNGGVMFNFALFGDESENTFQKFGLVDADGNLVWGYELPARQANLHSAKLATSDGGYLFGGGQNNTNKYVWKYTADGWNSPICDSGNSELMITCEDIILPGLPANAGQEVTWNLPVATTNCPDGGLTLAQISGPPSGTTFFANQPTEIVYLATDACGNTEECSFIVEVEPWFAFLDVECPDDITVEANDDGFAIVTWDDPIVTTDCPFGHGPVNQVVGMPSGSEFTIGTHAIEYTVGLFNPGAGCTVSADCDFTITVLDPSAGGCPTEIPNFTSLGEFNGSAYFLSDDVSRPVDAQAIAEMNGGYLAAISSQEENDFIQQNISEMTYIGLNDYNSEGNLEWFNGEAFTFDNINPCGFCNENSEGQDFVIMAPWNGEWSFSNFFNSRKYVMEIPCGGGNGGGDECSFNVTFDASDNGTVLSLDKIEEINGGYQMTSFSLLPTSDVEVYNYLRDKSDGSEVSTMAQQLIRNPNSVGLSGYWDQENNVFYSGEIQGGNSIELIKYDAAGNEIWSQDVNMSGFDLYAPLQIKSFDDEIIIICNSGPNNFLVTAKTDLFGNLIWKKSINVAAESGTQGRPYRQSVDGGFYIDYWNGGPYVAKVDTQGDLEWVATNGNGDPPSEKRIIIGLSGDESRLYFRRNSFNSFQGFLNVYDANTGENNWNFSAGAAFAGGSNAYRSFILNAIPTNDGGVVVFYQYHLGFAPAPFIYIHDRFDADGNLIWSRETPEEVLDITTGKAIAAEDGGFIFAKSFTQDPDWTILRMTSDGFFEPDCGGGTSGDLPDLNISNLTNFSTSGEVGEVVSFNFNLNNLGTITASGNYNINMYISTDDNFSADDVLAGEVPTGDTPVGTIADVPGAIAVPNLSDGNYFMIIVADALDGIEESDENNNTLTAAFEITSGGGGGGGCPTSLTGFTALGEFNGSAYFLSNDDAQPITAQMVAEQNGGYLAVINDEAENDFIQQNISEMTYIGLSDAAVEGELVWENGDPLNYNNINPCGFCNENSENQDYVIMAPWNGSWSFSNVWNSRKYIVEIPCGSTLIDPNNANYFASQNSNQLEQEFLRIEKLHPNPAMDYIFTTFQSPIDQDIEVQILDARGVLIKKITIHLQKGKNVNEINISNLANGFYTIYVPNAQGGNAAKRFVKI